MKHILLSTLFTLLLPLAACSEQELATGKETGGTPEQGFRLRLRLGNRAATRAGADRLQAHLDEKRIDRIAFFVHTAEDGLQVYPPAPDDGSTTIDDDPNRVHLAETAPDSRQYTADVTLTAGGGYLADIVAVANLPEDYDYRQIVSWDGLQDSVVVWATANMLPATGGNALEMPSCHPGTNNKIDDADRRAFAMYGYARHELVKEESNTFTLAMERLAARIDITNEAYVKGMSPGDPKGGFQLSSVRLLHARPASYVTPQADYTSPDVVTVSDWLVTDIPYGKETAVDPDANPTGEPDKVETVDAGTEATLQYLWRSLYTYENSDTEHAPTALEIKGAFRGMEVTRRIDFIDKAKQSVPIVRNHRYLVRILPAPGLTDIMFDIQVSEWDAVDTVNVKPDQSEVPEISNLVTNAAEYVNSDGETVYDLYYTQDGEMTFDATCRFASGVRVKYYDNKTGNWTTDGDWLKVEQTGEEVVPVTKADNTYKRSYKVSYAKFSTGVTRKAMLLVHNGGSEVECDTILIRHTLTYPGTDFEPAAVGKVNDKDIVWAPVNIGATKLTFHEISANMQLGDGVEDEYQTLSEETGYYYQWGREYGVFYWGKKTPLIHGPVSFEEDVKYQNTFIGVKMGTSWSTSINGSVWNKGSEDNPQKGDRDPCPSGWRIPTYTETNKLKEKLETIGIQDGSLPSWTIPNTILRFSRVCALITSNETDNYPLAMPPGFFWSSTYTDETKAYCLLAGPNGQGFSDYLPTGYAFPIRCVQE